MRLLFCCILSCIFVSTSLSSRYSKFKDNVLTPTEEDAKEIRRVRRLHILPRAHHQKRSRYYEKDDIDNAHFQIDPVLNSLRRHGRQEQSRNFENYMDADETELLETDPVPRSKKLSKGSKKLQRRPKKSQRRPKISRRRGTSSEFASTSSSREFREWKDEWKEKWIQKKFEAVNSTYVPGDTVNMLGARPWGVACGDPNQHDMPWGTCMLPMECDAEYRIYKGDFICGRTQFVCCALQLTMYDMYEGFDLSFENTGLETDSKQDRLEGSKEDQKKHRQLMKKKRKIARFKRRKIVERQIKKIQREIKSIIKRQERNATQVKKRKTRQLKRFYDMLKRQYEKDRTALGDMHELEMIQMDDVLREKLEQIRLLNSNFIKNVTFRDIIVNGTINRQAARMLVEAYPELENYIHMKVKRRSGGNVAQDYLDYDVEYGLLYF